MTDQGPGRGNDRSRDKERNRLGGRVKRYASVGGGMSGVAARYVGGRLMGKELDKSAHAKELRAALGNLKGPLMKVAQMLATIPEFVPEEYADELRQLQSNAPAMGWSFVRRRMAAEMGRDWQEKFENFEREAAAAASLGQVHRATSLEGRALACKLQYPDMQSAVEADLKQLGWLISLYQRMDAAIDPGDLADEIAARLREELDYAREAAHMALYTQMLAEEPQIRVPQVKVDLSTPQLLTMDWLEGRSVLDFKDAPQEARNDLARLLFTAWWHPFSQYGVIHGDPHLGNYAVWEEGDARGLNLLDFGCVRIFPPQFVLGVVTLYRALKAGDEAGVIKAYEMWGFENLKPEIVEALNIWARFIYGPLMDDRVRTIADGISPGAYGRKEAFDVHSRLKEHGPVRPPREFVFMDRAAIGLGAVFLHLGAELNFNEMFEAAIEGFDLMELEKRQKSALSGAGVPERVDEE